MREPQRENTYWKRFKSKREEEAKTGEHTKYFYERQADILGRRDSKEMATKITTTTRSNLKTKERQREKREQTHIIF